MLAEEFRYRQYVPITKQLDQSDGFWGSDYSGYDFFTGLFSDTDFTGYNLEICGGPYASVSIGLGETFQSAA